MRAILDFMEDRDSCSASRSARIRHADASKEVKVEARVRPLICVLVQGLSFASPKKLPRTLDYSDVAVTFGGDMLGESSSL